MWQYHLKIAWRHLLRHRSFTFINLFGLSIGMAAALLIFRYVDYERSYDKTAPGTDRIWRAFNETISEGQVTTQDCNTHSALGPALKTDLPEVADFFRLFNGNQHETVFYQNNQPIRLPHVWMADPGFLRVFPQELIAGDAATCLAQPGQILLSRSAAARLFPEGRAMGETLLIPRGQLRGEYVVSAIVNDPPQNTHLKFNALVSYATRYAGGHEDNWTGYWDYNYFQLKPGADPEKVRRQLNFYSQNHLRDAGIRLNMMPYEDIHLQSNMTYEIEPNGSARTVRFLMLAAFFVLAIACINYVNMMTARSVERGKEVGLRKVIGAGRGRLFGQFLVEGLLLNAGAMLVALGIFQLALPAYGQLMGRPLTNVGIDASFMGAVAGIFVAGVLASCAYPAWALTKFSPLSVMRGVVPIVSGDNRGGWLRKALVVMQFGFTVGLIFSVMVVSQQLSYLQGHDKGLSLDQIVAVRNSAYDWREDSLNRRRMTIFRNEIEQIAGIRNVAASSVTPGLGINHISGSSGGMVLAHRPDDVRPGTTYFVNAEPEFYPTYGIRFLAGAPYRAPDVRSGQQHVIINETAMKMLGIAIPEEAVGQEMAYAGSTDGFRMKIEGVVADFHIETLKEPTRPTVYFCLPEVAEGYVSVKVETADVQSALADMEQAWAAVFPDSPFEYWFLNEQFALQYQAETQLSRVFSLFALLAIVIACMGLYGMAAYLTARRTKEIGVRKVLGASAAGIVALLSKDLLKSVFAGIVVASLPAWYLMNRWLQDFAHRIEIQWWIFAWTGLSAVIVATLVVAIQAGRAALADPARSLRSE